jgi:hypothetical protein
MSDHGRDYRGDVCRSLPVYLPALHFAQLQMIGIDPTAEAAAAAALIRIETGETVTISTIVEVEEIITGEVEEIITGEVVEMKDGMMIEQAAVTIGAAVMTEARVMMDVVAATETEIMMKVEITAVTEAGIVTTDMEGVVVEAGAADITRKAV